MDNNAIEPSYWAVVPAPVRYDESIPPNAKILYAEISSLTHKTGYCFADDDYFHRVFGFSLRTIRRLLDALNAAGYIRLVVKRGPNNAIEGRRIYAGINPLGDTEIGFDKNVKTGENADSVLTKLSTGSDKIVKTTIVKQEILSESPLNPPKGKARRKRNPALKDKPDWKPDRFAGLREFYPKGYCKDKQAEIRAWDKLRLSDEEIDVLAKGLTRMKEDPEWKRGIGIPHLSTFLNQQRWRDAEQFTPESEKKAPPAAEPQNGGYQRWT